MRIGRIAAVTAGLAATGAVIGGALGAIVLTAWALIVGLRDTLSYALLGAVNGALLGAVLAPITAWLFLRTVPIGRALAETSVGTAFGALAGIAVGAATVSSLGGGLAGALVGFLAAAIRLRLKAKPGRIPASTGNDVAP